jgi:hypothetical protein
MLYLKEKWMRLIQYTIRLSLALLILTVIGQIRVGQRSLENRYHESVNSVQFQEAYWALMTPITYTYSKVLSMFHKDPQAPLVR